MNKKKMNNGCRVTKYIINSHHLGLNVFACTWIRQICQDIGFTASGAQEVVEEEDRQWQTDNRSDRKLDCDCVNNLGLAYLSSE